MAWRVEEDELVLTIGDDEWRVTFEPGSLRFEDDTPVVGDDAEPFFALDSNAQTTIWNVTALRSLDFVRRRLVEHLGHEGAEIVLQRFEAREVQTGRGTIVVANRFPREDVPEARWWFEAWLDVEDPPEGPSDAGLVSGTGVLDSILRAHRGKAAASVVGRVIAVALPSDAEAEAEARRWGVELVERALEELGLSWGCRRWSRISITPL